MKSKTEKQTWFPGTIAGGRRSESVSSSFVAKPEADPGRGTFLNPKLLEMVIKTINKRPSIAGEFQRGLAKTATQTWNTHLTERKKMTKKQKVVEEIASNLGIAKGFKTQFQDEAERLVSILFKEIGKRKPKEDEISSDEPSEGEEEDDSDKSIRSFVEPVVKSPPKEVKKIEVKPHQYYSPYTTIRQKSDVIKTEEDMVPVPDRRYGLSFINVKKIHIKSKLDVKEEESEHKKLPERTYVEMMKVKQGIHSGESKEHVKKKKKSRKRDVNLNMETVGPDVSEIKKTGDAFAMKVKPPPVRPSGLRKHMQVRPLVERKEMALQSTDNQLLRKLPRLLTKGKGMLASKELGPWDNSMMMKSVIKITSELDMISGARASISLRRKAHSRMRSSVSRGSRDRRGDSTVEFDDRAKEYVVQKIKDMLHMITSDEKKARMETSRNKRQETKSIFVLWKNYFDVRRTDNVEQETATYKRMRRDDLMKEVDLELDKAAIYWKVAKLLGDLEERSPYEQKLWEYLLARAKQINEDKKKLREKQASNALGILEHNKRRSRTPKSYRMEEERRRKLILDHERTLPAEPKRQVAKETTMEEILGMRGFRGPARNCKNTIWIRKPDFIDYLKPMKRKPKRIYEPPQAKLSKPHYALERVAEKQSIAEELTESSDSSFVVSIKRTQVVGDAEVSEGPPPVPFKRPKPCVEPDHGFYKYFGSMDNQDDSLR